MLCLYSTGTFLSEVNNRKTIAAIVLSPKANRKVPIDGHLPKDVHSKIEFPKISKRN